MSQGFEENAFKTANSFYVAKGTTAGSDFIYDETYKSYKMKQKF